MVRKLSKFGNSKGLIFSRDMQDYIGLLGDDVKVEFEQGRLVITASRNLVSFEEAVEHTLRRYDKALSNLAK